MHPDNMNITKYEINIHSKTSLSLSPSSSSCSCSLFSDRNVHLLQQVHVSLQHWQNFEHDICALLHEHLADKHGESEEHVQQINFKTMP